MTSGFSLPYRQQSCDVIPFCDNHVTLLDWVRNIGSTKESFTLLFDDEIFDLPVQEANIYIYIYIYWQKKVHKKGPLISKFKVPTLLGNLTFRDACPDYLNVFLWFAWTQRSGNWYRFWWRGRSFHFQLHPFKKLSKVSFGISVFYPVNKLKGELLIWYFNFSMAISQNICYRHPVWPLIKHCIFCVTITLSRNTILTSHTSID